MDNALSDLKQTEENYKKISSDLGRLDEELRQEQQHREYLDRTKKANEFQLKVEIFKIF